MPAGAVSLPVSDARVWWYRLMIPANPDGNSTTGQALGRAMQDLGAGLCRCLAGTQAAARHWGQAWPGGTSMPAGDPNAPMVMAP